MTDLSIGDDAGSAYTDPVQRLLTVGESSVTAPDKWPDYATTFGLGPEDAPELLRMACDETLNQAASDSCEVWAPVHAWRALGQLGVAEAVAPLLALLEAADDYDDTVREELPMVFGLIGPGALPPIAEFLASPSTTRDSIIAASTGLSQIALRHPQCRDDCIALQVRLLEPDAATDETTKGFVVADLLDVKAVEAIDAMRQAYRRDAVDISVAGDLEDVEVELGLRSKRSTPAPRYQLSFGNGQGGGSSGGILEPIRVTPQVAKVGRNDPCPCGSGRKYKKCCLP